MCSVNCYYIQRFKKSSIQQKKTAAALAIFFLFFSADSFADFAAMTSQIARTVSSAITKNLNDNLIIPQLKVKNRSGRIQAIDLDRNEQFLALLFADQSIRVWDLNVGVQRPTIKADENTVFTALALNAINKTVYAGLNNGAINAYDINTGTKLFSLPGENNPVTALAISVNPIHLLAGYQGGKLKLWKLDEHSIIAEKQHVEDISKLAFAGEKLWAIADTENNVQFWAEDKAQPIKMPNKDNGEVIFLHYQQKNIVTVGYKDGTIIDIDARSGKTLKAFQLAVAEPLSSLSSYRGVGFAYINEDSDGINVQSTVAGKTPLRIPFNKTLKIRQLFFIGKGRMIITADQAGNLTLWNVATGKQLLQIFTTGQGWTVLDNRGRFDSSEAAMKNISWQASEQEIPLDNFSGNYYEPGLLAAALLENNDYVNSSPRIIQKGIRLPPRVELASNYDPALNADSFELIIKVTGQGGGIDKIRLYQNSKAIELSKRFIAQQQSSANNIAKRELTVRLDLLPGENEFRAAATNKMSIEGKSAKLKIKRAAQKQTQTLRIITVGINKYSDPQLHLDYSVADAETIAQSLTGVDKTVYDNTQVARLYNENATKLAILTALQQAGQQAAEDTVAVYLAGHGLAINNEWYFLPTETKLMADMNYYTAVGISAQELSDIFTRAKAQRILLLIDSCYSGGSIQAFYKLQNTQRHFSRAVSKSAGIVVLTATRQDQEAAELADLKHGLFTYVVANGIQGKADGWPADNIISAHEITEYSTKTIPAFSKKYLRAAQEPSAFTMGQDFSLTRVR